MNANTKRLLIYLIDDVDLMGKRAGDVRNLLYHYLSERFADVLVLSSTVVSGNEL